MGGTSGPVGAVPAEQSGFGIRFAFFPQGGKDMLPFLFQQEPVQHIVRGKSVEFFPGSRVQVNGEYGAAGLGIGIVFLEESQLDMELVDPLGIRLKGNAVHRLDLDKVEPPVPCGEKDEVYVTADRLYRVANFHLLEKGCTAGFKYLGQQVLGYVPPGEPHEGFCVVGQGMEPGMNDLPGAGCDVRSADVL
jgi:hypothetical protein